MKNRNASLCFAVLLAVMFPLQASVGGTLSSLDFAGEDGLLDRRELALFLAYKHRKPISECMGPGQVAVDLDKVEKLMYAEIATIRIGLEAGGAGSPPWKPETIDSLAAEGSSRWERAKWKEIPGLTKKKPLGENGEGGSIGPVRLRKSERFLDVPRTSAKGASIGFSDNRLKEGRGAWNTEGALGYPVRLSRQDGGGGKSVELEAIPFVSWNLAEVEGSAGFQINELTFGLPFIVKVSPGVGFSSAKWFLSGRPYYMTDFDFDQSIYGLEARAEYVGGVLGTALNMGGFYPLFDGLRYSFRVTPAMDYSITEKAGNYTSRQEGDDWLRVGAFSSLDLRFPFMLDVGLSYLFFETVSGSGGYSDLLHVYATWWPGEHLGMTVDYSKGETPVAARDIDLVKVGVELRY